MSAKFSTFVAPPGALTLTPHVVSGVADEAVSVLSLTTPAEARYADGTATDTLPAGVPAAVHGGGVVFDPTAFVWVVYTVVASSVLSVVKEAELELLTGDYTKLARITRLGIDPWQHGPFLGVDGTTMTVSEGILSSLSGDMTNPMTTEGDMIYQHDDAPTRLPIGTEGQVLTTVSGDPAWETIPPPTVDGTTITVVDGVLKVVGETVEAGLVSLTCLSGNATVEQAVVFPVPYTDPPTVVATSHETDFYGYVVAGSITTTGFTIGVRAASAVGSDTPLNAGWMSAPLTPLPPGESWSGGAASEESQAYHFQMNVVSANDYPAFGFFLKIPELPDTRKALVRADGTDGLFSLEVDEDGYVRPNFRYTEITDYNPVDVAALNPDTPLVPGVWYWIAAGAFQVGSHNSRFAGSVTRQDDLSSDGVIDGQPDGSDGNTLFDFMCNIYIGIGTATNVDHESFDFPNTAGWEMSKLEFQHLTWSGDDYPAVPSLPSMPSADIVAPTNAAYEMLLMVGQPQGTAADLVDTSVYATNPVAGDSGLTIVADDPYA